MKEGFALDWFWTLSPALPHPLVQTLWLHLSWALVLACVAAFLLGRISYVRKHTHLRWRSVALLAAWCCVPGPWAPPYWLGLAFQAPSVMSTLLCTGILWSGYARLGNKSQDVADPLDAWAQHFFMGLGMLLGWVLMLDMAALLPVQWYAWGFAPLATLMVLMLALAPWIRSGSSWHSNASMVLVAAAVLVFVVLRLPSGNVWDAVLDPWLWVALHVYAMRRFF